MTRKELDIGISKALKEAYKGYNKEEIPVGCCLIIPKDNYEYDYIVGHNTVEKNGLPFEHAEINTINKAIKKYKKKHFLEALLVVTLEPCPICYYAIRKAGIKEIYYLLTNQDDGAFSKEYALDRKINGHLIENKEFKKLFTKFFDEYKENKKLRLK